MTKTVVIGGGASGLFAGCFLKKEGQDFVILERNGECGRKLLVTGHGRCNITNNKEPQILARGYHEASGFVYPALRRFTPGDCIRFLEDELGLKVKTEEDDRIFPVTDKAADIRDRMVSYIGRDNIITGFKCASISKNDPGFTVRSEDGTAISSEHLILACGGMSYPKTGSDGSGYELASSMGHSIVAPRPALAMIPAEDKIVSDLSGVTAKDVVLSLYVNGRKTSSASGDLLFTHRGLSGPAAMELAREIPVKAEDVYVCIDFATGVTDQILLSQIASHPRTLFVNVISEYVPRSLADKLCTDNDIRCSDVTAAFRKETLKRLREYRISVTGVPDIVSSYCTRGGVDLKEIDRKTYGSKIVKELYIVGENCDVDGISGGYNLAFAAASSFLAVSCIVGYNKRVINS